MKQILFIFSFVFFFCNANAQMLLMEKTFGGTNPDYGTCIDKTSDGGFILSGFTTSSNGDVTTYYGSGDIWIVKTDVNANIEWQKTFGGTENDAVLDIISTTDGGYIFTGHTASNDIDVSGFHGWSDIWLVKINGSGNLQWQKCLGGTQRDLANKVLETADGGYIVFGSTNSMDGDVTMHHGYDDIWVVKVDSYGNLQWEKTYGGTYDDEFNDAVATSSGYTLIGESYSSDGDVTINYGLPDVWLLQIDNNGNLINQHSYGGSSEDVGTGISSTVDGGFIFTAWSYSDDIDLTSNNGAIDYWVVKLDQGLNIQWQHSFGGSSLDFSAKVLQTYDNGFAVCGYTQSNNGDVTFNHGGIDYWILKLDQNGNLIWEKCLGGPSSDYCMKMLESAQDLLLIGKAVGGGDISFSHGNYDYWLVKLGQALTVSEKDIENPEIKIFPNPSTGNFTIQSSEKNYIIQITDVFGKQIYSAQSLSENFQINLENKLSAGMYFVKMVTERNHSFVNRIIVE